MPDAHREARSRLRARTPLNTNSPALRCAAGLHPVGPPAFAVLQPVHRHPNRTSRATSPLPLLPRFRGFRRVGRRCLGAVDEGQNNGEPGQHSGAHTVSSQLCQPAVTRRQGLSRLRHAAPLTGFSQMTVSPHLLCGHGLSRREHYNCLSSAYKQAVHSMHPPARLSAHRNELPGAEMAFASCFRILFFDKVPMRFIYELNALINSVRTVCPKTLILIYLIP